MGEDCTTGFRELYNGANDLYTVTVFAATQLTLAWFGWEGTVAIRP